LPLVLLNLGHHENLLWAVQHAYVLPVALMLLVVALLVRRVEPAGLGTVLAAAIALALLPLGNAAGLGFVPGLALWFGLLAWYRLRTGTARGRRQAVLILLLTLPAVALVPLYFRGYQSAGYHPAASDLTAAARTTLQFLAMGLGSAGARLAPASGLIVLGLLLTAVVVLVRAWFSRPGERPRVLGLSCALASFLSVALAIGWGRGGQGEVAGLQDRYVTLSVPGLILVYLVFALYGPGSTRRLVPMSLLCGLCLLAWPNTQEGLEHGRKMAEHIAAFDRDLAAGMPAYRLARRHAPYLHPSQDELAAGLRLLRTARVGRFSRLRPDPAFGIIPLPVRPTRSQGIRWSDGLATVEKLDAEMEFDLPSPRPVAGVRLRYDHESDDGGPAHFRLSWRRPSQFEAPSEQEYRYWFLPTGTDRTITVWIDDVVEGLQIQPDTRPCRFRIRALELLVP
jgi:hypothetical protein